jgi:anaerobic selenocysteine-containing dehydrogenase
MIEYRNIVCSHDCPDSCSVRVGVEDDRIVSIGGDPQHPITRGFLCGKVNRYTERVYSPQRVRYPQRRVGAKGEGRFERISWDEALDEIVARFQATIAQHGAEAILPYSYGGNIGLVGMYGGHRLFFRMGASHLKRTICTGSVNAGSRATHGDGVASDIEDIVNARLILVWGCNAVATHVHLMPFIKQARAKGAKLVVIDTYRNATARQADLFLQVRPGTDAALALGMMREIIAGGHHDMGFIDRFTLGFEQLREGCADYTPQRVQEITGVPAEDVAMLGRLYGKERRAFIRLGMGLSRHGNGGMTIRTISCLPSLTGAWEHSGGGLLNYTPDDHWHTLLLKQPAPTDPPARELNMVQLGDILTRLDDPPIKAMYVYGSNPAAVVPDQSKVHAGLAREDLFLVVHEQTFTDTTDFADIVLPATTFMEHDDVVTAYGHLYAQYSRAAIPPLGESRPNWDVFNAIAARMGFTDPIFQETYDTLLPQLLNRELLTSYGFDWETFLAGKPVRMPTLVRPWEQGLTTDSGKIEFFSQRTAKRGLPGVPAFVPLAEGHEDNALKARYPLQLVTAPAQHFLNSTFGDTVSSPKLEREPLLQLHPAEAAARDLREGDAVRAFNDRGESYLTLRTTRDVMPGVAVAESVWWPRHLRGRKGINQLTTAELTDMGSGGRFHDALIQVEAAPPA